MLLENVCVKLEWEREIMTRSENLGKKIDMERLQRMSKRTTVENVTSTAVKRGTAKVVTKVTKQTNIDSFD